MTRTVKCMTYLTQTRIWTGNFPYQRGNGFATAVACLMGLDNPEEVFQVQEHYDHDQVDDQNNWVLQFHRWLRDRGFQWYSIAGHRQDNQPYLVIGSSPRYLVHVCIYQNGKLLHDPHPEGGGLLTEDSFEVIEPI